MLGDAKLILSIICFAGGALLLLLGFLTRKSDKTQLYKQRCKEQTKARIDGFDDRKYVQRKQRANYNYKQYTRTHVNTITYTTPIVRFHATDGKEYRVTYLRPIEKKLALDQIVDISYNPENPYEIIIHGDKRMKVSSVTSMEFGLIMLIAGVVICFVL